jgi:cell division protein FtsQ
MPRSTGDEMTQITIARTYSRREHRFSTRLWRWGDRLAVRALARAFGCLFLCGTVILGLVQGRHMELAVGQQSMLSRIAPIFGYSAQRIRIGGLKRQTPEKVLAALGIQAGSPLFGLDEETAQRLLENIDWVQEAQVRRIFPNALEIDIIEREPFAIWQNEGRYYVIDRSGAAMSLDVKAFAGQLPLVTGKGAQEAAYDLFNQLQPHSALREKLKAAARVGHRRWTLYFANGVKAALPEKEVDEALNWIETADAEHGLLSKAIASIDLRLEDRIAILPRVSPANATGDETVKVSRR